ncbi:MAG: hypothetical protein GY737_29090 [Desulfobacteraceae bacterium]|nr:hypothetical protein [Desulfobacteraceae bacterium]
MSRYRNGFPKYVSVAEKRAKAEKKLEQLKKKNPDIAPIEIKGRKLAESWWGISWNKNLESYADFSNRIGRGRSYVRHGAVLDLRIEEGRIISLVQGSASRPYKVEISIKKLPPKVWKNIIRECRGEIGSLGLLVEGKLPKAMEAVLTDPENGIFPSPSEIGFDCSCPDWAFMCKHVAATLYGVGARLDQDPSLFFTLRGVKMEALVSQAVKDEADALIKRAKSKGSKRIIQDADLSSAFGIDMEDLPAAPPKRRSKSKKKAAKTIPAPVKSRKASAKKTAGTAPTAIKSKKSMAKKAAKSVAPPIKRQKSPTKKGTDYDMVVAMIRRRRVTGIGVREIKERTAMEETKIRNIIFRAKQKNEIRNISRGLYTKGEK